jgi:hypothetical protein
MPFHCLLYNATQIYIRAKTKAALSFSAQCKSAQLCVQAPISRAQQSAHCDPIWVARRWLVERLLSEGLDLRWNVVRAAAGANVCSSGDHRYSSPSAARTIIIIIINISRGRRVCLAASRSVTHYHLSAIGLRKLDLCKPHSLSFLSNI